MTDFLTLKNVHDQQGDLVGEKAITLAKLYSHFSIPQGFIITKSVFEEFLRETGLLAHFKQLASDLQSDDEETFQAAANKIQKEIVSTMVPREMFSNIKERYYTLAPSKEKSLKEAMKKNDAPFVAVRSCAVHYNDAKKFHLSFTNIQGEERLKKAILTTWASFFTAAAIKHRRQQNVQHGSLAILIQQMLTPTQSGTVYSTDPEQHNQILIKACRGLGTAICHKEITPDTYNVDKQMLAVTSMDIQKQAILYHRDLEAHKTMKIELEDDLGSEQKLTEEQIKEVALLANRVETQLEKPQVIEFAFDKGMLYILQSNDIPGLEKIPNLDEQPAVTVAVVPEELPDHPTQHQELPKEETNEEELLAEDEEEQMLVFDTEETTDDLPFADIAADLFTPQQAEEGEQQFKEESSGFSMILKPTEALRKSINGMLSSVNMSLHHEEQPVSMRFTTAEEKEEQKEAAAEEKTEKAKNNDDEWSVENTTYLDDEAKEKETDEMSKESSTDDGIFFALPEETTQETKGEPALAFDEDIVKPVLNHEKKHHMLYEHTKHAAAKLVISCYMTINAALKHRYKELKGSEPNLTFNELALELKDKIPHYDDVMKINELRHAFIEDLQHPSSTEIKQALDVCETFVKEF